MRVLGRIEKNIIENCKFYGTGHLQRQCHAYGKICGSCSKSNHFKAVCKIMHRQQQGQRSLSGGKAVHEI